jgi:hypothetical protein
MHHKVKHTFSQTLQVLVMNLYLYTLHISAVPQEDLLGHGHWVHILLLLYHHLQVLLCPIGWSLMTPPLTSEQEVLHVEVDLHERYMLDANRKAHDDGILREVEVGRNGVQKLHYSFF